MNDEDEDEKEVEVELGCVTFTLGIALVAALWMIVKNLETIANALKH